MHFGSSTSELCCTNRHLTKTSDIVVKLSQCAFNTLTFKLLTVLLNNEKNYGFSEAHDFWLENYGCSEDCYWLDLSVWVILYPVSCDQFHIWIVHEVEVCRILKNCVDLVFTVFWTLGWFITKITSFTKFTRQIE